MNSEVEMTNDIAQYDNLFHGALPSEKGNINKLNYYCVEA